jgi:hypothetical protein
MGITNQIVGNLASGPHKVTITEVGYYTWEGTVTVNGGEITYVTATLQPEKNMSTGDLHVASTPPEASVYVNQDYKGVTGYDAPLDVIDLAPGTYTVLVKKTGYDDYSVVVAVKAGMKVDVDAQLTPSRTGGSTATIVSNPAGADVYINNMYMGITPLSFPNVSAGTYTLELKLANYNPYVTTGTITTGQNIMVNAALSPIAKPTPTTKTPFSPFLVVGATGAAALFLCMAGKNRKDDKP